MPTQLMTYAELGTVWGVSTEAARKKVEGLRLPRQTGNDGKTRVMIDITEVQHEPMRSKRERKPSGDRAETEALKQHVETLRAEVDRLQGVVGTHRADYERERERAERAITDLLALTDRLAEAEKARADGLIEVAKSQSQTAAAQAELTAWKSRRWWRRALG